jgi:3-oxoadipate enol-lactonase
MTEMDQLLDLPSGGRLRVRVRGEGPPIVWCHGVFFPIEVDDHSTLGRVLCGVPGMKVVRFDARGHGQSPPGDDALAHRWDTMAEDVLGVADALGLDTFALGGISMGSAVALGAALRCPARVRAMLLVAPPTAWDTRPPERTRYLELLALGSSEAVARRHEEELAAAFGASIPPALVAMIAGIRKTPWAALSRVLAGAAESDMPSADALGSLQVPVLVRPWPDDAGHPLSTAETLASALPRARHAVLSSFDDDAGMRAAFAELHSLLESERSPS